MSDLNRLRWHSRRGMLELDILLARFWARWEGEIGAAEAAELEKLLDLEDNDLLQLILGNNADSVAEGVLRMLREC